MADGRRVEPLWIEWPQVKVRRKWLVVDGDVREFVVQLEYDFAADATGRNDPEWATVARFDHDVDGPHDVGEEGLHLDVYRDGEKYRRSTDFPPVPVNEAIAFCEQYFRENATYLLARFERWHDVERKWATRRR